jgi:hypothetical protein
LGETASSDGEGEQFGAKVKNFEIDGEPMSGTAEARSSAPTVTSANNPSERFDASVGGVTDRER